MPDQRAAPVLVIVPTYDERANLAGVLARLRAAAPEADVLVVDDASPDGTGELADRLAGADAAVAVLHRPSKDGLGSAYRAGFAWARQRGYGVVVESDADGSHLPEELPRLLAATRVADVALGTRWVAAGAVRRWPSRRRWLSRSANGFVRRALDVPLADATGGFRAFRREVLDRLTTADTASEGYCFQVELAWRAWRAGFRIAEVPITFVERENGTSKMNYHIVAEALRRISAWGATRALGGPLD